MEPTARRDLQQQQQQSSSGRRMKSFYADYKSTKELTSSSFTPSHPPSLPLLHYSDTLLSIWKFARLSGGQRKRDSGDCDWTGLGQQWTGTGEKKLSVRQAANSWLQAA